MGMERRKSLRIPTSITVDVKEAGSSVVKGRGQISDLGIKGVAIDTAAVLDIGTPLFLKINVPIEVKGKVVRVGKKDHSIRYGVKFTDIGIFDKIQLKKFISAHFKK